VVDRTFASADRPWHRDLTDRAVDCAANATIPVHQWVHDEGPRPTVGALHGFTIEHPIIDVRIPRPAPPAGRWCANRSHDVHSSRRDRRRRPPSSPDSEFFVREDGHSCLKFFPTSAGRRHGATPARSGCAIRRRATSRRTTTSRAQKNQLATFDARPADSFGTAKKAVRNEQSALIALVLLLSAALFVATPLSLPLSAFVVCHRFLLRSGTEPFIGSSDRA
jgi:hypothetical protein